VERSGSTLYVTPSARLFERLDDSVSDGALLVGALAEVVTGSSALQ
jgi:hypothetical protein